MVTAERTIKVAVSKELAWKAIADFKNIHLFHPMVVQPPLLGDKEQGIGAVRRCDFKDKTSILETIIDWQEGESLTVELTDMSMPLKKAQATMRVSPAGSDESFITLRMDFTPKGGLLGWVMGVVMMKPMVGMMFNKVLKSLSKHLLAENQIPAPALS